MMKQYFCLYLLVVVFDNVCTAQHDSIPDNFRKQAMDKILSDTSISRFNGVVLIAEQGSPDYFVTKGYANMEERIPLDFNSQFVIGSISKQITAVLVLREFDKQHLQLDVPIRKYLPELKMSWADTVTVHHLLTHMHGIEALDKPLRFVPGTQFEYGLSDIGYHLLSGIVANVSGKSFAANAKQLFSQCEMKQTFHPAHKKYKHLVKGYTEQSDGKFLFETASFENDPAAGGFISTAADLLKWNRNLHNGKLLKPETYHLMVTPKHGAVRQHRLWGETYYGYGITVENRGVVQLGQTGFAPGFASMDYYFPATGTSVIVLENTAYRTSNLKRTFYHHVLILKEMRRRLEK